MKDYFKYDILYVMNITDVDDKIIRRARRNHLLSEYASKGISLGDMVSDVKESLQVMCIVCSADQLMNFALSSLVV